MTPLYVGWMLAFGYACGMVFSVGFDLLQRRFWDESEWLPAWLLAGVAPSLYAIGTLLDGAYASGRL